jgi:hypothetical protein
LFLVFGFNDRVPVYASQHGKGAGMSNELWNLHCTRSNDEESDFDSVTEWASSYILSLERRLAECQARKKVLRDALEVSWTEKYVSGYSARKLAEEALTMPSDSTALDEAIRQAKREALLTAADVLSALWGQSVDDIVGDLRRMAEGIK